MDKIQTPDSPFIISDDEKEILLKAGTLICIKHARVSEGIISIMERADTNHIYAKITEAFLKSSLLTGDSVICQIIKPEYEYAIHGEIKNIDMCSPGTAQISINKIYKYKNFRKDKRYLVNFRSNIVLPKSNQPLYAVIKNISKSGFALVTNNSQLEKDSLIQIKFPSLQNPNELIESKVKVVRILAHVGYVEYGCVITEISDSDKEMLLKLISQLEENEKAILKNL